ncbi:MAG: hypothetical protein HQM16_15130 [Deltaproteobacteria bacterium]|nr:hypothetical protein [Deltaproteobacteria bacterium]
MRFKHFITLAAVVTLLVLLTLKFCEKKPVVTPDIPTEKMRKMPPLLGVHTGSLVPIKDHPDYAGVQGLEVRMVIRKSIAFEAGIKPGDLIIEYDGFTFDGVAAAEAPSLFTSYIAEKKNVGDPFSLKIYRIESSVSGSKGGEPVALTPYNSSIPDALILKQKPGEPLELTITKESKLLEITVELGQRPHFLTSPPPDNAALFPAYETTPAPYAVLAKKLIDYFKIGENYKDLIDRYKRDEWWDDGFRLNLFRYIHRDPFKLPQIADDLTDEIKNTVNTGLSDFTALMIPVARSLDAPVHVDDENFIIPPITKNAKKHFEFITSILEHSKTLRETALKSLSEEEKDFLYTHLSDIMAMTSVSDASSSAEKFDAFQRMLECSHKINYTALLESARVLYQLTNQEWLISFKEALLRHKPDKKQQQTAGAAGGDVMMVYQTTQGPIIVGGPEKTIYTGENAFIIDLGGDDFYRNNAGAARSKDMPLSFVIDFGGDDQYTDTRAFTQGAGFLGNGFLVDLAGNDLYIGLQLSQGVGFMGTGLLVDREGNDQYEGQEYNQGVGYWGTGIVADLSGDDTFNSHSLSQGLGGPKGMGLLFDIAGNDTYYATGKLKCSYGMDGIFTGMSQGFGFGLREYASGGIGMLLDSQGSDHFYAGNFSQGGGYFFGLGILKNSGDENDRYDGSRYAQGFSAHSAAGILIDEGGDDTYVGRVTALQGAAWDLGSAALIDKSGNDVYDGQGLSFSQGSADHNGFALFVDMNGSDVYKLSAGQQGQSGDNAYHGGTSLGIFIDNGGDDDIYGTAKTDNNTIRLDKGDGLFLDLDAPIESVLADDAFIKLINQHP